MKLTVIVWILGFSKCRSLGFSRSLTISASVAPWKFIHTITAPVMKCLGTANWSVPKECCWFGHALVVPLIRNDQQGNFTNLSFWMERMLKRSSKDLASLCKNQTWRSCLAHIFMVSSDRFMNGGARSVMVIVVGNGHSNTSSNPGQDWLHFT